MLSAAQAMALFPRAAPEHRAAFATRGPKLFERNGIKGTRLHFLLAQLGHESGGLTIVGENLNYSAKRLMQVFPRRFPTLAAAQPFANNPEKLANQVYGGRLGNGPSASGDGYRYRGRGYIQITGRENYRDIGRHADVPIGEEPDRAAHVDHALEIACGFWKARGLNAICDTGDFTACTRRINGGTIGIADRRAWLDKVIRVMALPSTPDQVSPETIVLVQRALQKRGFTGIGAADGDAGPRTLAAVSEFRRRTGLSPGTIDEVLLAALHIPV